MLSRSACVERVLGAGFLLAVSCASPKPGPGPARESAVTLEGEITLSGPSIVERRVMLADAGGGFCALKGDVLEDELRSLAGHRVRVTGRLAGKTDEGAEFLVDSYELAPVNGYRPVIGIIQSREGALVLRKSPSGPECRLEGRLAQALWSYIGYKVWVSGPGAPPAGEGEDVAAAAAETGGAAGAAEAGRVADNGDVACHAITVESYGVLVPAGGTINREP